MEAFEQMLQSWSCVLQETNSPHSEQIKTSATLMFDTYLKSHLAPPSGNRQPVSFQTTNRKGNFNAVFVLG